MIVKEPQEAFWGGYHAYFVDLDGYYWEAAWGPDFKYDEDGTILTADSPGGRVNLQQSRLRPPPLWAWQINRQENHFILRRKNPSSLRKEESDVQGD